MTIGKGGERAAQSVSFELLEAFLSRSQLRVRLMIGVPALISGVGVGEKVGKARSGGVAITKGNVGV